MSAPLRLDLPPAQRLAVMALVDLGLFGSTPQEVAGYLILRGLDDLLRSKVLRHNADPAAPTWTA